MENNNNGQSKMDSLIYMNDLQQLIKEFSAPSSAISGLTTMGGQGIPELMSGKLIQALGTESPRDRTGFNILDMVSQIAEGKEIKDKFTPGWDDPQIGSGGIGGSMQREPEKMQGLMALLQRFFPGGKTGYR